MKGKSMSNNNANHETSLIRDHTYFLNTFNKYWATLKSNHEIKAELDLNSQIRALQAQLRYLSITPMTNMPSLQPPIPWSDFRPDLVDAVDAFSAITGWDRLASLISVLTAVVMASSGAYTIMVKSGWLEPLNMYTMNIAPSGANKSAAIKIIRKPFNTYVEEQRVIYDRSAAHQTLVVEAQTKAIKKLSQAQINAAVREGLKNGDADVYTSIIQRVEEEMTVVSEVLTQVEATRPYSRPNFFLSDCSSKGLQAGLSAQNECLAICEPEGDLMLKAASDPKFDIAPLLKGFGREEHIYSQAGKDVCLHRPSINILYGVQPELAAKFYRKVMDAGRGLDARFIPMFVCHQSPKAVDADFRGYDSKIRRILADCYSQNPNREERFLEI
jgi:hypothetical protein